MADQVPESEDGSEAQREEDYRPLQVILTAAYDQAARGKGRERHARGLPFDRQPMQAICDLIGNSEGLRYQAIKKIVEGGFLPPDKREHETLGAINYLAGDILWCRRHNCDEREGESTIEQIRTEERVKPIVLPFPQASEALEKASRDAGSDDDDPGVLKPLG